MKISKWVSICDRCGGLTCTALHEDHLAICTGELAAEQTDFRKEPIYLRKTGKK